MPSHQNFNWRTGRHNVSNIPNSLRCKLCNRTRPREQYSNNELASFDPRQPDNLRCMACLAVNQATELECMQCGVTKDIYKFSKSSRKNGGNKWCLECTLYKEAGPPVQQDAEDYREDGNTWDDDLPINSFSHMSMIDGSSASYTRDSSVVGSSSGINAGRPSNLHTDPRTFGQGEGQSAETPRATPGTGYMPPHLRALAAQSSADDTRSVASSVSNPYRNTDTETTTSTAGEGVWRDRGVAATRRQQTVAFTGFASDGTSHPRYTSDSGPALDANREVSTPQSQPSAASIGLPTQQARGRVPLSRPQAPPSRPSTTTVAPTIERSGGWAKASGNKYNTTRSDDVDDGWPAMPRDETHEYDSDDRDEP